ncbi:MAG: cation:proton antiporter [Holophagales bacterium]|nr:MAG: cation:proton antiporter [Holophagales bacterium]
MTPFELSILFFLALAAILTACRLVGYLARYLGQPQVVGEMIAGVLIGPSLLGWLAPDLQATLFPKATMPILYAVAQLGLVLYMFLVGLDFDVSLLRRRARSAMLVSWAGILTPFTLGAGIAWAFHGQLGLFAAKVSIGEAALFMGAAMSITAFPMLARIIYERGLSGTSMGTLALAAGSADDAAAWCILAVVLASFKDQPQIAFWAIGGGIAFAVVAFAVLRPLLARAGGWIVRNDAYERVALPGALTLLMLAAWYTDKVGIYAVFGAFVLGASMPRGEIAERLEKQIQPLTVNLLLPLFFVYSGLNTRIGLVDTPILWFFALLVLLAACLGKGVACYLAARWNGEPPREAVGIGALMNARGLMELIILNIGLERGVITPTLFSIMVVMAIATTLMALPVFNLAFGKRALGEAALERPAAAPGPLVDD